VEKQIVDPLHFLQSALLMTLCWSKSEINLLLKSD